MNEHEIFKPESKTIKQVFGDVTAFYQMPDYQRPYSWEDEQVEQLWEDLHTAYAVLNYDYYLSQTNIEGMFLIDKMKVIYIPNDIGKFKNLLKKKIRADYGFNFNKSTDANSVYQFYIKK